MFLDLLDPANFIMVNRNAIRIFGLTTAVYSSEIMNIYKKAVRKKKIYENTYIKVDRDYITKQTSLTVDEQLKCDLNLAKIKVITIKEGDPDMITFDDEVFASLLSSEDVKLLRKVSDKVQVDNPKGVKQARTEHTINALKDSIECKDIDVLIALRNWVDSIFESGKGMSKTQIKIFKDNIDDYCNGNKELALKIIQLAIVHSYIDCQWAINVYEKNNKGNSFTPSYGSAVRVTPQKITTEISDEIF